MKVFGIGLQKTGTTTLGECLKKIGYKHKTYSRKAAWFFRKDQRNKLKFEMDRFDSFEDEPWAATYKIADELYPDAKFILTVRSDADKWYESMCKHCDRIPYNEHRKFFYGSLFPRKSRKSFIEKYENHNAEVIEYFKGREDKLLIISWEKGNGWELISNFLNKNVPNFEIPKANSAPSKINAPLNWFRIYMFYPKYYFRTRYVDYIHPILRAFLKKSKIR